MQRHSCPGHPDCYIDCPAGGTAVFHEPLGPCVRRCHPDGFGESILRLSDDALATMRVSGVIEDYPMVHIGTFAQRLARRDLPIGRSELRELILIAGANPGERFYAHWQDVDLVGLLEVLMEASASGAGSPLPT